DQRTLSRHPSRARLSGAARSHRKEIALRPAAGRTERGRSIDRIIRYDSGKFCQRLVFLALRSEVFRPRQDRAGSGRGLRAAQGNGSKESRKMAGAESELRGISAVGKPMITFLFWNLNQKSLEKPL